MKQTIIRWPIKGPHPHCSIKINLVLFIEWLTGVYLFFCSVLCIICTLLHPTCSSFKTWNSFPNWIVILSHLNFILEVPSSRANLPNEPFLLKQSCFHKTTNLLRVPATTVDPKLPLTYGVATPNMTGSRLPGFTSWLQWSEWYGVILSSCDYSHSLSVISVRINKDCRAPLLLIAEKVWPLWAPVPLHQHHKTQLCLWHQKANPDKTMHTNVPLIGSLYKQVHHPSYLFIHVTFTCWHI